MSDYHRSVSEDEEDDDDLDDDEEIEGTPELEDNLSKWTNYLHGWQDRWVVLREGTLSYFKARNDISSGCRGSISLARAEIEKGRGLHEKLAEMETFRDILCRQVDSLQGFFDTCAEQYEDPLKLVGRRARKKNLVKLTTWQGLTTPEADSFLLNGPESHRKNSKTEKPNLDLATMGIDFRGEALTFKATTAGILTNLSHCIDLIRQREEQWKKRLEREQDKRRKAMEAYKNIVKEVKKKALEGGPDFQEGPHSLLNEDQFFDAIETALDINDSQEEEWNRQKETGSLHTKLHISRFSTQRAQCQEKVDENVKYAFTNIEKKGLVHQEGELQVYKSEQEIDGIIVDPLKAIHTVKGVSAYEMCFSFWDVKVRMEWDRKYYRDKCKRYSSVRENGLTVTTK
ncbi:putative collagen type IV alpha-3-binding protein-like isoform X1 [Apostichopus japonicus]|uniref:Putative collagen type IV alpha-3-binding protein-like isoform X1 n=1 Tax=Stichopus japonicus TaxID=307972 RepID=A0A2G8K838_STIJA|nr:putative collagen type IV alpha-3-binding protein-like isoform X1 [Apostichopus japonicus]